MSASRNTARTLALLAVLGLCSCAGTRNAAQQDMSNMVSSMGLHNLGKLISTRPAGGMNTYDPATGKNL